MLIVVKMVTRIGGIRSVLKMFMNIIVSRNVRIEEKGRAGWSVKTSHRNDSIVISIKKKDVSQCQL